MVQWSMIPVLNITRDRIGRKARMMVGWQRRSGSPSMHLFILIFLVLGPGWWQLWNIVGWLWDDTFCFLGSHLNRLQRLELGWFQDDTQHISPEVGNLKNISVFCFWSSRSVILVLRTISPASRMIILKTPIINKPAYMYAPQHALLGPGPRPGIRSCRAWDPWTRLWQLPRPSHGPGQDILWDTHTPRVDDKKLYYEKLRGSTLSFIIS